MGVHFKKNKIISYMQRPLLRSCLLSGSQKLCKNQKAWEEEFSGIKPNLLILAGFLLDNFEGMEVTGQRFVAIFDQGSASG